MRPTRILLIKHGDPHKNYDDVCGGPRGCRGLTDLGRRQAGRLRDRLEDAGALTGPVAVYSSIIPRAIETAQIVAEAAGGVEVVQDCGLCSFHMPAEYDGMPWEQIRADHGVAGGGVFHPFQRGFESWSDLVNRAGKTLTSIAARHAGRTVLIGCHFEIVESSLIAFGALPIYRTFDVDVAMTSVTEWTTTDDPAAEWDTSATRWPPCRWTLTRFNDSAHLDQM